MLEKLHFKKIDQSTGSAQMSSPLAQFPILPTFLAFLLMLLTPLLRFLINNQYPVFSGEIFLFIAIVGLESGLLTLLLYKCRFKFVRIVVVALLFCFVGEMLFRWSLKLSFPISIAVIFIIYLNWQKVIAVMMMALVISLLVFPSRDELPNYDRNSISDTHVNRPNIIHVILDEHGGVEGIPESTPGNDLKEQMQRVFERYRFHLHGGAFSHFDFTIYSIPNLFNYYLGEESGSFFKTVSPTNKHLKQSRYFEMLQSLGYQFNIYQFPYLDYCAYFEYENKSCYTYGLALSESFEAASLWQRANFVLRAYLLNSTLLAVLKRIQLERSINLGGGAISSLLKSVHETQPTGPLASVGLFDRALNQIEQYEGGGVFLIHQLLPHKPYIFTSDCAVKPVSEWLYQGNVYRDDDLLQLSSAYVLQTRCLLGKIDDFLGQLEARGILENSIVLFHGDHGSRISDIHTLRVPRHLEKINLTDEHYLASFSTLYAIRFPDDPSYRYFAQAESLQSLFSDYSERIESLRGVGPLEFGGQGKTSVYFGNLGKPKFIKGDIKSRFPETKTKR